MTTRELPPAEWPKLETTNAVDLWRHLNPARHRVIVVEDHGEVVGSMLLMQVVHAECLWIAPAHRKTVPVGRRLLQALFTEAGAPTVLASAVSTEMVRILDKLGTVLPGTHYVLPIKESALCLQS